MKSSINNHSYPYGLPRNSVFAKNGMVATSQPLASQAGLEILKKGGNAVDAAIATAACLTVVEPTSNGIGGDAFAIVWMKDKIYGINGSGGAPDSISIDLIKKEGYQSMPKYGWYPVTVPGAPKTWAALSEKFGVLSFKEVLSPAISYAQNGFPVSLISSSIWEREFEKMKSLSKREEFSEWFEVFAPKGRAPFPGENWSSSDHAETLNQIANTNGSTFYTGDIAKKISDYSKQTGGLIRYDDLASFDIEWVNPINLDYKGYDIWELPPNSQGIITLQALNILKEFDLAKTDIIDNYHKQIEAIKLAFSDGLEHISDLKDMIFKTEDLLSEEYARNRAMLINNNALTPYPGNPESSGTVYLATADKEGNMVSFIQSNYKSFGSGVVVPGTGVALQNRGMEFSLDKNHVNSLKGKKKPYHTIIPGFLSKDNKPIGPFGVMGGYIQPQGHVQLITNTIDFGLNPQSALDAPRWKWIKGKQIEVENHFPHHIALGLMEKGHEISGQLDPKQFGRGQIIWRDYDTGMLVGGTESRTDGTISAW